MKELTRRLIQSLKAIVRIPRALRKRMRGFRVTRVLRKTMIGVSEEANKLIRRRAEEGKFVPRAGQMAFCQHGILGFVEDAVVRGGELLFRGRRVADPFKNWQSKDPVQYKEGSHEEREQCEADFSYDAGA